MSNLCRIFLLTILLVGAANAQEPVADDPPQSPPSEDTGRIVEGRPLFYSLKRNAHPLTWFELAVRPIARLGESERVRRLGAKKPDDSKVSGIRFGVGGDTTGSGFGPKVTLYHKDFLGRGIDVEIPLLYTYRRYEVYRFKASVPLHSRDEEKGLRFDIETGYFSRARDDFFGVGNESLRGNESQLRTVTREASAGFSQKLDNDWSWGLHGVYRSVGVTEPMFGTSAQSRFNADSVPGLFGATLRSAVFSFGRDNRERENYRFQGGSDQFEVSFNESARGDQFRYWRYMFDSEHFFALTNDGRKMIAFRGLVETNVPTSGHDVPFFDMPFLGSQGTMRGFENFRFRDRSALALTLEYRYRIWRLMDAGLFVDEGQVAPQLGDMGWSRFHTGYGARIFLWAKSNLPISFDYGRSNETWRFYINLNKAF
jgi:outer membrane protein assembly factor BamA